jgi:hypothetical protein
VTVWCSDHDPMLHMKGMHGICLRPGRAIVELKARLYNRTPFTQTFLKWANAATRAHEQYQSFFHRTFAMLPIMPSGRSRRSLSAIAPTTGSIIPSVRGQGYQRGKHRRTLSVMALMQRTT